jgi:hypothetical protein
MRMGVPGLGSLFVVGAAIGLAQWIPETYEALTQEDGLVEWATFVAFLAAGALFLKRHWFFIGLALFCFFVAGEEISWAQRLFAFQPPEIFLEHNYQQESNLHNLLKDILDTRWIVLAVALLYGVAWPLAALKLQGNLRTLAPSLHFVPGFVAVVLLEAYYPFELSGEVAELALGLCFLAEAIRRKELAMGWIPAAQAACFVAALGIVPLTDHVMYGDDEVAAAKTRASLERLKVVVATEDVVRKKLFTKRRVHKRIYTAVKAKYFRFGPEHEKEWGYFLDAWNQPLWIESVRTKRGQAHVVFYSFGPNRRRDADDIKVEVDLVRDELTYERSSGM